MESHKIWIANLQDMLLNHVCQGFLKTHAEIVRLCGGYKLKVSIQTAMEGIAHLSAHKINSDYRVLIESLSNIGITEKNLNDLILNSYSSYALTAIRAAGIKCERLDPTLLNGPYNGPFIHEVYINVARNLWMRPDVLIDQNIPQLKQFVKDGVEQSVRNGVNLNFIVSALNGIDQASASPSTLKTKQTIRERMNMINGSKTLLDDSDDDEIMVTPNSKPPTNVSQRAIPAFDHPECELTIDNDDLAPDNMTITFDPSEDEEAVESVVTDETGVTEETGETEETDVTETTGETAETEEETSYTIPDASRASSSIIDVKLEGDDEDVQTSYTVSTIKGSTTNKTSKSKSKSKSKHLKSSSEVDISDMLAGEVVLKNQGSENDNDTVSTYSVTLLSHNDMLSSRLSRLGTS
jgi:hypothetical protein